MRAPTIHTRMSIMRSAGTECETKAFMAVCIETAKRYSLDDYRTPVFIFERLCSIIYPVSLPHHTRLTPPIKTLISPNHKHKTKLKPQ